MDQLQARATLDGLRPYLSGKVVILGIGSRLQCDDAAGSVLAERIKGKIPYLVFDAQSSPENYLGKIAKENPNAVVIIDAMDFKAQPGEFSVMPASVLASGPFFTTHDAPLGFIINYLKSHTAADIIGLFIQPDHVRFGEALSPQVAEALAFLEQWFYALNQEKR
jgi:hydrogenase 3 maturation protease